MVFVEEVAEVLDKFARLVRVKMVLGAFEALRELRPDGLRLCAQHPAERISVFLAGAVEPVRQLLPVAARRLLANAWQELRDAQKGKLVARVHD